MKVFSEADIEQTFEWLEANDDKADAIFRSIDEQQPELLAYLFSESFDSFSNNEKELLVFGTLVIYQCTASEIKRTLHLEDFEKAENANYDQVDDQLSTEDQMTKFFENYVQEDLLAFAEDFIGEEEEDEYAVSTEAKLPLFIALKSIIDVITAAD